ncbi:MAG: NUDIX domain-containing protein [Bacteroidales bacterium]|jgi:8-oxo-dGTP pyrophosphatase MutT (NUDIX family)|nr:NUDIX domain-containing protein [Bacteroidales bacterium]
MYKVFYNQRTVFFIENNNINQIDSDVHFFKNKKLLYDDLNKFLNTSKLNKLYIIHKNVEYAFKQFAKLYQIIEAAGGLVKNEKGEILVIYRRNIWDLPKGKIEKNELPKVAAIREVEEECGIRNIEILNLLEITYHTYKLKGKDILKKTYWYEMFYNGTQNPEPQVEEEITEAKWLNPSNLKEVTNNTFPSIIEVFKKGEIMSSNL